MLCCCMVGNTLSVLVELPRFTQGEELAHAIQDEACADLWICHSSCTILVSLILVSVITVMGAGGAFCVRASTVKVRGLILYHEVWR